MIPIRVDSPPDHRPRWVWLLVALNVATWLAIWSAGPAADALIRSYGLVPARLLSPESWHVLGPIDQLGPLLTHAFLHQNLLHLLVNLWALALFGAAVEARVGPRPFIGLYLLALAVGAMAQGLATPGSVLPIIGASGAIAGLMGAQLALGPAARVLALVPLPIATTMRVPGWALIGAWGLIQVVAAVGTAGTETAVAWWAHVGGFAAGVCWAIIRRVRWPWALVPRLLSTRSAR